MEDAGFLLITGAAHTYVLSVNTPTALLGDLYAGPVRGRAKSASHNVMQLPPLGENPEMLVRSCVRLHNGCVRFT